MEGGRRIQIDLNEYSAMVIIGNLQLALRHPDNVGPSSDVARDVVKLLIGAILRYGMASHLVESRVLEEWKKEGYLDETMLTMIPGGVQ